MVNGSAGSMPASTSRPFTRRPCRACTAAAYDSPVAKMISAPPACRSAAPLSTTISAPSFRARSCLSGERVTATVSNPQARENWRARCPRPPMPRTATRSCGAERRPGRVAGAQHGRGQFVVEPFGQQDRLAGRRDQVLGVPAGHGEAGRRRRWAVDRGLPGHRELAAAVVTPAAASPHPGHADAVADQTGRHAGPVATTSPTGSWPVIAGLIAGKGIPPRVARTSL